MSDRLLVSLSLRVDYTYNMLSEEPMSTNLVAFRDNHTVRTK